MRGASLFEGGKLARPGSRFQRALLPGISDFPNETQWVDAYSIRVSGVQT